jgi:alkylhydroperoxidase/carboxymuconolactone decarboxylase family protein YurZ
VAVSIPPFLQVFEKNNPEFYRQTVELRQKVMYEPGALDVKTKLLIAFALDVSKGALDGVRLLAQRARDAGASEAELEEVLMLLYAVGGQQNLSFGAGVLRGE